MMMMIFVATFVSMLCGPHLYLFIYLFFLAVFDGLIVGSALTKLMFDAPNVFVAMYVFPVTLDLQQRHRRWRHRFLLRRFVQVLRIVSVWREPVIHFSRREPIIRLQVLQTHFLRREPIIRLRLLRHPMGSPLRSEERILTAIRLQCRSTPVLSCSILTLVV